MDQIEQCRDVAELLKTMGHPTRVCILRELMDGTKCVSDLQQLLTISQPNVSQHLNALRIANIINYDEDGKRRCYYLTDSSFTIQLLELADRFVDQRKKIFS